jgi:hypothetical protein
MKPTLLLVLAWGTALSAFSSVEVTREDALVTIANNQVSVTVDSQNGFYQVCNPASGEIIIDQSTWGINEWYSDQDHTFSIADEIHTDALGSGRKLMITGSGKTSPNLTLEVVVYDQRGCITLSPGLINTGSTELRIRRMTVLNSSAYPGKELINLKLLDGESGGQDTAVHTPADLNADRISTGNKHTKGMFIGKGALECHNSILLTSGAKGAAKQSLVFGGLTYHDFKKRARFELAEDARKVMLWAEDPVGKRVPPGATYHSPDRFYLDASIDNRFEVLESYGLAMRAAMNIENLSSVTYPVINFWYARGKQYGNGEDRNTATGTIKEMDEIAKTGFLKYAPVGLRIEHDDYSMPNNQQGWWDDEHFRMYKSGMLDAPYDSIEKWGQAIIKRGGVPMMYCQTARRSQDYADTYPEHMLFDNADIKRSQGKLPYVKATDRWGYDFTNEGFRNHMKEVYANYCKGGVMAMKFDYPSYGWAYDGGMDNPDATTASAYREIYRLATEHMLPGADIHERLPMHGDVCLGVVTTHRTEPDTDTLMPAMIRKVGLRWYKNRVVVCYDKDVNNPFHAYPNNRDGVRAMLTMNMLCAGRNEFGKYFEDLTPEMLNDMARVVPGYDLPRSPRPLDAFERDLPQVYDLALSDDWHQLTLYNTAFEGGRWPMDSKAFKKLIRARGLIHGQTKDQWSGDAVESRISIELGAASDDGGLALDPAKRYHLYDFWNDRYLGTVAGDDTLQQQLRAGEARVLSIHAVSQHPQWISTNRHILQGLVDLPRKPTWKGEALSGSAQVVGGEPFIVVIAGNGRIPTGASAEGATAKIEAMDGTGGLYHLILERADNAEVPFSVTF